MESNSFNSQQNSLMNEQNKPMYKIQPIAFNYNACNQSQYYNHNQKFIFQPVAVKNVGASLIENIPSYQNYTNRRIEKFTLENSYPSTISKIIPYSNDLIQSKHHAHQMTSFIPNNSFHSKATHFSNSKHKNNKSPPIQIHSQRLDIVGNISPNQNPEGKIKFFKNYNSQQITQKNIHEKLKTQTSSFEKEHRHAFSPPRHQIPSKFQKKTMKKQYKVNQTSQQLNLKKLPASFPLNLKNRSKTFETNTDIKFINEQTIKEKIVKDPYQLQINIQDALQFRDTQTRRGSECSSSRNQAELKLPSYFKTRQTTKIHKQSADATQIKNSLAKATKELNNQSIVNKLLKQRLQYVEMESSKKQQRMKKLEKQLVTLRKKCKEYSIPKKNSKQKQSRYSQQGNQLFQFEAEKKWLKQQILLLNMTLKKFTSLIEQKDHEIIQISKKLQDKQSYCERLQKQNSYKNKNHHIDFLKDNDIFPMMDENTNSMIIRNDISNDFDPLEGYNIELDYLKIQNTNLLELLGKAEEEIQKLKNQNIRLRYQNQINQNSKITNKSSTEDSHNKFLNFSKNQTEDKKFIDLTIQQCYKQVLKVFGVSTDLYNQYPRCHNELMNEIDYFKKSLLELLEQTKSEEMKIDAFHQPQSSKKHNAQFMKDRIKAQLSESISMNNQQISALDKNFYTKEELEKILVDMNERIEKLQPQIINKFSYLLKRLYNIVRILCEKFGPQLEKKLIQLMHQDEVLSQYAPF